MEERFEFVTFDCYGTLIDWEDGLSSAFLAAAQGAGVELQPAAVIREYHEVEPVVEGEQYRSYREVLSQTAQRVARTFGWELSDDKAGFLAESLPRWKPFPDTNAALERLRDRGIRLGILSNVDDDLLAETRRLFTVDFDLIVTAQQVKSYKPKIGHFLSARQQIGELPWLHAARSYFHDVVPARALNIPVAWVNREGDKPAADARPDYELSDLGELARMLAPETTADRIRSR